MKKAGIQSITLVLLLSFLIFNTCSAEELSIIPLPQQLSLEPGSFSITTSTSIHLLGENPGLRSAAEYFAALIEQSSGITLPIDQLRSPDQPANTILLALADKGLDEEGYELLIGENGVLITGGTPQGVFYGLQSLRQLLPPKIESPGQVKDLELKVPFVRIRDLPRFGWRGLMLDESRHFFGKPYVKKLLERMAMLKLNVFHWHLTDSPGWRLEIRKYPRLTTVGGIGNRSDPHSPAAYYTQEDIREIVAFAAVRHIQVLPEIDMPGHATAANRAYPENSGGGNEKRPDWTFNPGREETYSFLTDILRETSTLFPAPLIHYGGDEVHFANAQWADIPEVNALMTEHDLDDLREVEHYFNRRMADEIHDLGKKTVAWDEVVDAGVDADKAIIIWWRHNLPEQLSKALDRGYEVVLSPRRPLYLDFVQYDSHQVGRRWDGFNDLKQVYDFPRFLDEYPEDQNRQILGMQASMWTETVQTRERADFMIFPRLTAMAEAAWTESPHKNYENYRLRLKVMLERFDVLDTHYFDPFESEETPEPKK